MRAREIRAARQAKQSAWDELTEPRLEDGEDESPEPYIDPFSDWEIDKDRKVIAPGDV